MTFELHPETLRVAMGLVLVTTLVLFYAITYRVTRAPFVGHWCLALLSISAGTMLYVLNGTPAQRWANPVGNAVMVLGVAFAVSGSRSLRGLRTPPWLLSVPPAAALAASWWDDAATNVWSGAEVVLGLVGVLSWMAAVTLWTDDSGDAARLQRGVGVAGALFGTYYLLRLVFFVLLGPDDAFFGSTFGAAPTTLAIIVLLIATTFAVAALHTERQTMDLQVRASRDGLTGLLNRQEFLRLAEAEAKLLARSRRPAALVLVDIDHFKQVNDQHGHDTGDQVLRVFASSSRRAIRSTDLLGRYGGEEFVFLLPGASTAEAEHVMQDVRQQVSDADQDGPSVTASFGVAPLEPGASVEQAIAAADAALYRAKAQGRDRVVVAEG